MCFVNKLFKINFWYLSLFNCGFNIYVTLTHLIFSFMISIYLKVYIFIRKSLVIWVLGFIRVRANHKIQKMLINILIDHLLKRSSHQQLELNSWPSDCESTSYQLNKSSMTSILIKVDEWVWSLSWLTLIHFDQSGFEMVDHRVS